VSERAELEYQRAVDVIKSMITGGKLSVGGRINVPEIQKRTGTTYATARRVAKELATQGILQSHPGAGFAVIALPEEADAERADTRELAQRTARLSTRQDTIDARLERIEANLEDLYDKLGYTYATDGTSERREDPAPAARRGRTG
jgi:DNA-binding GntR family transcriptional regulator